MQPFLPCVSVHCFSGLCVTLTRTVSLHELFYSPLVAFIFLSLPHTMSPLFYPFAPAIFHSSPNMFWFHIFVFFFPWKFHPCSPTQTFPLQLGKAGSGGNHNNRTATKWILISGQATLKKKIISYICGILSQVRARAGGRFRCFRLSQVF